MSNQYLSFDVTKQSSNQQLIVGRQGDGKLKFVTILFWDGDKNIPYDLTGKNVIFEALKPDDTVVIDENVNVIDAQKGLSRYPFDPRVFGTTGTLKQAFFKIISKDGNGNQIADSTLELSIKVLSNDIENGIESESYLSKYDELISEVEKKFNDYAATVQDSIDKAQEIHDQIIKYTNLINSSAVVTKAEFGDVSLIKQPAGVTAVDKLNNEFSQRGANVKWYGAKGDGVTDDTQAFKDAFADTNSNNKVYVPAGEYVITDKVNVTKSVIFENAKIIGKNNAVDYLFSADTLENLEVIGFTQSNPNGRGAFSVKNVKNVIVRDFEASGYSAETSYYKTDSALMLWDNENVLIDNINVHDHGFQYDTTTSTLNRSVTIQGDLTKTVIIKGLRVNRVNQGLVLSVPNADVLFSGGHMENTTDNDLYLLGAKSFLATHSTFNDYYDESVVMNGGNYEFRACRFTNIPNKVFAISGDTESLIIQDNDIVLPDGYSNNVVAFRDFNSTLKRFSFSGNNVVVNPAAANNNDIFQFGQMDNFIINDNNINVSRMNPSQIMFSFRNANEALAMKGVMRNNTIRPYGAAPSISGSYRVLDSSKQNISIDYHNNESGGGRFTSALPGVVVSGADYFAGLGYNLNRHLRRELFANTMPSAGYFNKGDVIYNTEPDKNNIYAWVRKTTGTTAVDGVDWATIKTVNGNDDHANYVRTQTSTFNDLATVAANVGAYQGTWWYYKDNLLNSPITEHVIVEVIRGNTDTVGVIRVTGINTNTMYMAIVNNGLGPWVKLG